MGKEFLGCPLRKLNNLDIIVKTIISEIPAIRAKGTNAKNSFLKTYPNLWVAVAENNNIKL